MGASAAKLSSLEDKSALRGNPSFVWRAGQERRFQMVREWIDLTGKQVLDVGCGIGMYTAAFLREAAPVFGVEIEYERAIDARERTTGVVQAPAEHLPFASESFDVVFSHEVLEHVQDDAISLSEMTRVTRPGGHLAIFVPNRLYPFETHGVYWRGIYHFGNVPIVNWLPSRVRNRLAPHVRAYTSRDIRRLMQGLPVQVLAHSQVFAGYDNIVARYPALGRAIRSATYSLEHGPLRILALSHFLVLRRI